MGSVTKVPGSRSAARTPLPLGGKLALVTGAGGGIGRAIAEQLSLAGAAIVVNDIDEVSARATVELIVRLGGSASAAKADISDEQAVSAIVAVAAREYGRGIDVLVNNAAHMTMANLTQLTTEQWARTIAVDLTGCYLTSRAVLPYMLRAGWGRIVNIASEWGITGAAGAVAYCAAKAGVIGFTKSLAKEVAGSGIRVNAVAPGITDTDQLGVDAEYAGRDLDAIRQSYLETIPVGRLGTPRDVALTVAMLCGEAGDFYSGQVFCPNGGTS